MKNFSVKNSPWVDQTPGNFQKTLSTPQKHPIPTIRDFVLSGKSKIEFLLTWCSSHTAPTRGTVLIFNDLDPRNKFVKKFINWKKFFLFDNRVTKFSFSALVESHWEISRIF